MKPLKPAHVDLEEATNLHAELLRKWRLQDPFVRQSFPGVKTDGEAKQAITLFINSEIYDSKIYRNDVYQVAVRERGKMWHLSIKRIDRQPIHDWRDLQEIKNQLVGPECEGLELYPAESRVVDTANQYHLWCVKDPAFRFQFGFEKGYRTEEPLDKAVNRPFA